MEKIYFYLPTRIYFERNGIEKYLGEIKKYGKKVFIVTGKNFVYRTGLLDKVKSILEREGIKYCVFSGVEPEPPTENVEAVSYTHLTLPTTPYV